MRNAMRCGSVLLVTLLAVLAGGAADAARSDSEVTMVNRSSWDIYEIYLSPVEDDEWGDDLLEDDVLVSGDSVLIYDIPCGDYDILLVDEDADECILEGVGLCGDSEEWVIRDRQLLACQFGS